MSTIFTTKTKANIIGVLFIILLLWFSLSMFSNILVNEEIFIFKWTNLLAIILTLLTVLFTFKPSKHIKNKSKIFIFFGILFTIPLLTKLFLERSVPALLHSLSNSSSEKNVIVLEKSIGARMCKYKIQLKGYNTFYNGHICNVNEKFYNLVKEGDELTLVGYSSIFGFTVEKLKHNKTL